MQMYDERERKLMEIFYDESRTEEEREAALEECREYVMKRDAELKAAGFDV